MPQVVQQSGQPGDLPRALPLLRREGNAAVQLQRAQHLIEDPPRHVHHAQGVAEAGMGSSGEHQLGQAELGDAAQPLHEGVIDDVPLAGIEGDRTMERAAHLEFGLGGGRHGLDPGRKGREREAGTFAARPAGASGGSAALHRPEGPRRLTTPQGQ